MRIRIHGKSLAIAAAAFLALGVTSCSGEPRTDAEESAESSYAEVEQAGGEHAEGGEYRESREGGEHAEGAEGGEGGEHAEGGEHSEEGEESGVYIGQGDTWDVTRRGARLVLAFDPAAGAFKGKVLNTTDSTLCAVRVEVHLSTGTELGPTDRTDVPAGETADVELSVDGEEFDTWTAHPEMSACSTE